MKKKPVKERKWAVKTCISLVHKGRDSEPCCWSIVTAEVDGCNQCVIQRIYRKSIARHIVNLHNESLN